MESKIVLALSIALVCDGATSGQREQIEPMTPEQAVTVVPNQTAQTLWYLGGHPNPANGGHLKTGQ